MNFIQDISDLEWLRELDSDLALALEIKETHTTVWACFSCTYRELHCKLDSLGLGFGCIDINVAHIGYDWHPLETLEDSDLESLADAHYSFRYILDTVSRQ